jgi:NADP-dependent 3-hydroxy acid dehydrogenase YdfG
VHELQGKAAVVTGATSGIGAAIAAALLDHGVDVVACGRRADRLDRLPGKAGRCAPVAADLTEPGVPEHLVNEALARFGRCDIVVHAAGLAADGTIEQIDLDRVDRMVRLNVEAAFRFAYVALRHFRAVGAGHLIALSSVLGTKVRPTTGPYAGTKFAVEALFEALRMEVARSAVQVSCIEPGFVATELHRDAARDPIAAHGIEHPLTPEDVADCVLFVLTRPAHVRIPRLMILPGEHLV